MILKEIIKKANLISNRVVIEETNCIQLLYKSRLTIIGWFIRILHVIGASLFILLILLHLIRAIWIKLKVITIKNLSFIIIITGYLLFILSMIEGFLGHLLCWGQMSYWGITVMINIVAVLPCCGIIIAELIWSAAWVILNRIFVYHFLIG